MHRYAVASTSPRSVAADDGVSAEKVITINFLNGKVLLDSGKENVTAIAVSS